MSVFIWDFVEWWKEHTEELFTQVACPSFHKQCQKSMVFESISVAEVSMAVRNLQRGKLRGRWKLAGGVEIAVQGVSNIFYEFRNYLAYICIQFQLITGIEGEKFTTANPLPTFQFSRKLCFWINSKNVYILYLQYIKFIYYTHHFYGLYKSAKTSEG